MSDLVGITLLVFPRGGSDDAHCSCCSDLVEQLHLSRHMRKPAIWASDLVQHKSVSTVTEERSRLETYDVSRTGIVLSK